MWLKRGLLCSKRRCPSLPTSLETSVRRCGMSALVIGLDPHKASNTIAVLDADEMVQVRRRFGLLMGWC